MDHEWFIGVEPGRWHLMKDRMTITAVFILFVVVFCMVALRLYVRWYVLSQLERQGMLGNVVFYGDDNQPISTADPGLEPEVLNSLPVFSYSSFKLSTEQSMQECTVCLSEFEEDDAVRLLPKCNHSFHVECIDMWLHSHSTCPICRSKVEAVASEAKPAFLTGNGEMIVDLSRSESSSNPRNENGNANMASLQGQIKPVNEPDNMPGTSHGPAELDIEGGRNESSEIRRTSE